MSVQAADDVPSNGEPGRPHSLGNSTADKRLPCSPDHKISGSFSSTSSPIREALDPPNYETYGDLCTNYDSYSLYSDTREEDCSESYLLGKEELAQKTKKKRWLAIYVIFFTMFMSAVTFSICLSSIWPYLLEVDYKHASATFLGWIVAAYSFGQLIASPFFGFWADKRPTREPLIFALLINVIFNVLYCYCGAFQAGVASWMMLVSRAMVGFGAGIAAVVRSYVSESTTEKERTGALAGVSSAQAIGFILGPALGLAFVPLGYNGLRIHAIKFSFNMYTGPGYLSAVLGVVNIVLLIVFFREFKLTKSSESEKMSKAVNYGTITGDRKMNKFLRGSLCCLPSSNGMLSSVNTSTDTPTQKPYDRLAALVCIFLFFIILFVFAVIETLGSPLSMDEFAWTKKEVVLYNNIVYALLAVVAVATFIIVKFVTKKVDERIVLMVALFIVAFGYFAILPMTSDPPPVAISSLEASSRVINHSEPWILETSSNLTLDIVGCRDPPQTWCTEVGRIYLFQYGIAMFLLAVGYPAANLITYAIFSKILGPFPQGTMMGFLTAAGSLARALGPLIITLLYHAKGPAITFATVVALVGVAIVVLLIFSRRLVPYRPAPGYRTIN